LTSGTFRHGPQEVIRPGMRFAVWIEKEKSRDQDLAMAQDLRKLGTKVLAIGQDLPANAVDLVSANSIYPGGVAVCIGTSFPIQMACRSVWHV